MLVLVASHEIIVGMTTVAVTTVVVTMVAVKTVAVTMVAVTQAIGVMIATDVVKVNVMATVMTVNGEMMMSIVTATEEHHVMSTDWICSYLQKWLRSNLQKQCPYNKFTYTL